VQPPEEPELSDQPVTSVQPPEEPELSDQPVTGYTSTSEVSQKPDTKKDIDLGNFIVFLYEVEVYCKEGLLEYFLKGRKVRPIQVCIRF
jgi:hypothetical protein